MIIKNERPPVWDSVCEAFKINPTTAVFTYGDIIYNPSGADLLEHILLHESIHRDQQGDNPELWWGRYLRESSFRIDQEARAYGAQYKFICKHQKARGIQFKILNDLSSVLSGPLYAKAVTHLEAMRLIKLYSK